MLTFDLVEDCTENDVSGPGPGDKDEGKDDKRTIRHLANQKDIKNNGGEESSTT